MRLLWVLSNLASFLVFIAETPVVVVMARRSSTCELVSFYSGVVEIRDIVIAHLISISEQNVDTVVMFEELVYSSSEGIGFSFVLVHPMIY